MMRVIHFFDFKPGIDEREALKSFAKLERFLLAHGCIERRTMKLLDATANDRSVASAQYINESLWPGKTDADAAFRDLPPELAEIQKGFLDSVRVERSVRFVDL